MKTLWVIGHVLIMAGYTAMAMWLVVACATVTG